MKSLSNVTRWYPQGLRKDVGDIILVLPTDAESQHQVAYKLQYSNYKQLKDLKVKHIFIHFVYILRRQNNLEEKIPPWPTAPLGALDSSAAGTRPYDIYDSQSDQSDVGFRINEPSAVSWCNDAMQRRIWAQLHKKAGLCGCCRGECRGTTSCVCKGRFQFLAWKEAGYGFASRDSTSNVDV